MTTKLGRFHWRLHMTVALVLNGIPDLQASMAEGLESLRTLLADRESRGCTVTPTGGPHFGVEYRNQHPGHGVERAYLTDSGPANHDRDAGGS
jgi:hypothetical protein